MKRFLVFGALLSLVLMATSAVAWEFSMTGKLDWDLEYFAQGGKNGFFGIADDFATPLANGNIDAQNDVNLQFWAGRRGFTSGLDAERNRMKIYFNPEIRINRAVRIRGVYRVGGAAADQTYPVSLVTGSGQGNWADTAYDNSRVAGTDTAFALGEWTQLWATAELPFGIIAVGKRPFTFGNGLFFNGEEVTTTESLLISAPYGPLTIIGAVYSKPAAARYTPWHTVGGGGVLPYPALFGGDSNATTFTQWPYNRPWDATSNLEEFVGALVYRSASLESGIIAFYDMTNHVGPEERRVPAAVTTNGAGIVPAVALTGTRQGTQTVDWSRQYGIAYMKYCNGRFFLNGDLGWWFTQTKYSGSNAGAPAGSIAGSLGPNGNNRPFYEDSWSYMVETGALMGPSKLSFLYYHRPGRDRRGASGTAGVPVGSGALLMADHDSQQYVELGAFSIAGTGVTRPYSFILGWTYGSGAGAFDANGHGYFNDATVLATRLDYAVGANLNVWGSALYAERATKSGWSWGCLLPRTSVMTNAQGLLQASTAGAFAAGNAVFPNAGQAVGGNPSGKLVPVNNNVAAGFAGAGVPNIPDPSLGWEFGVGMNWQLLQGYTWNLQTNYWMPGGWFNYACRDRGAPDYLTAAAATVTSTTAFGTKPGKSIDSVVAVYSNFVFDF